MAKRNIRNTSAVDLKIDAFTHLEPVTPGEDALPEGPARGLVASEAGTADLTMYDGAEVDGVPVWPGVMPFAVTHVRASTVDLWAGY